MKTLLSFGTAATIALVIAGCGDTAAKNDYVKSVNKAETALQKSLSGLGSGVGGGTAGAADRLTATGKALDDAAKNFSAIDPPDDAKHAHGEIVDGLHKLGAQLRGAAKSVKGGDRAGFSKAISGLGTSPGAQEIQKAQDELAANGYKVAGTS